METTNIHGTDGSNLTVVLPKRPSETELRQLVDAPSHVYFIYSAGLIKIGYSANWLSRVEDISQSCPHPAEVILVMPGDRAMEAGYHALFADYRVNREWFSCEGKMREFLQRFASPEGLEALEFAEANFARS